jgi:RimJ/RimL family protein N-acetyltransferase
VSDAWIGWSGDPLLTSQMNARASRLSRADLQRYVAAAWKSRRMIIGIYARAAGDHIGLYETSLDPRHGNVTIDTLVDQQRHVLSSVLTETDPVLLDFFFTQHRIDKAIAKVVETNTPLIHHYENTGWLKEGVLRQEVEAAVGGRRLDIVQFGMLSSGQSVSAA